MTRYKYTVKMSYELKQQNNFDTAATYLHNTIMVMIFVWETVMEICLSSVVVAYVNYQRWIASKSKVIIFVT